MEIPCEIYSIALEYLRAKDVSRFRAVSKEHCRASQVYEGDDTPIKQVDKWRRCFPKAKVVNLTGNFNADENDFIYFTQVIDLTISLSRIRLIDNLFLNLQHLKHLNLLGYENDITPFQDGHCKHLTNLKSLTLGYYYAVTDDGLLTLTQLEELTLRSCKEITSRSIRGMKRLKRLEMYKPELLTDDAFEGSNLEEIKITYSKLLSDRGICHLKRLKKLTCFSTPNVIGKGFHSLLELNSLWLSDIHIRKNECMEFINIRELHFYNCTVECNTYPWKKTEAIYFYECKILNLYALDQLNTIPSLKKFGLFRFDANKHQISRLQSLFGNKMTTY